MASARSRLLFRHVLLSLEALSYVAGVVALLFLWLQMRSDAQALRSSHSFEFVQQFNSEAIATSRRAAMQPLVAIREQIRSMNRTVGMTRVEIDEVTRGVVRRGDVETRGATSTSIQDLVAFIDQMKICVDANVCDENVLRSNFASFGLQLHCSYGAIINDLKETSSAAFGQGLAWLISGSTCPRA